MKQCFDFRIEFLIGTYTRYGFDFNMDYMDTLRDANHALDDLVRLPFSVNP